MKNLGKPSKAIPCQCDNPLGDSRDMMCVWCGHQIGGVPLPSGGVTNGSLGAGNDRSSFAAPKRRYRPAA